MSVPTGDIDRLKLTLPNLHLLTNSGGSYSLVEFDRIDKSHGVSDTTAEEANERLSRWRARCVSAAIERVLGLDEDPAQAADAPASRENARAADPV